jgi:MoaA/NifB/PqqE/SkfB family radical SAM enzyme
VNSLSKYLWHKFIHNDAEWHPLAAVYYLTYRCEFRCSYCSDGNGVPYYRLAEKEVSAEHAVAVIKRIRRYSDILILTGGEPLSYPNVEHVLKQLPALGFKEVIFTTNGFKLNEHLDAIAGAVTKLIVSIDTMDSDKADALTGMPKGTFQTVLSNFKTAAQKTEKKYDLCISSVATPDNLEELRDVYFFAENNSCTLAVQPQLVGVKAHQDLLNNKAYRNLYDFLIEKKRGGGRIYGSIQYLQYMRDIRQFSCSPFTMLVVTPTGDVFYPCLEIGNKAGNILDYDSLYELRKRGQKLFGPQPVCDNRCQSACALGFFIRLQYPFSFAEDVILTAKGFLKRKICIPI